ncbi:osmotically inducible protein C [Salipaludibacillus keqinensis]|jgi:putative redox protein|uniref:Osmotically inducible protein C n=1 Tax=Salipaludibacillus keqinensis TaxID=2045207 RepID=A0A323TCI3_9BACI|nr:OsmC family protein [Salipaludibacillus keqinensis]PYZ92376.1 osmotically inducible protein C [Salipaludibacillus keqinensis]
MKFHFNHDEGFETEFEFGKLTVSGNEEKGYRPFQLMVSSIAVCSGSVLRKVLEKQRMSVEDLQVEADVTRDPERANRLTHIKLHYVIKGEGLTDKKVAKAVELASKNCPMAQTVIDSVELTETFEIK